MEKIILACDLDNTLLYSYRYRQPGDICVEWINGKRQGYMTPKTIRLLRKLTENICLIPVTSRSADQYRRIQWPGGCQPEYAVTTNGGLLLHNGETDREWQAQSLEIARPFQEELYQLHHLLEKQNTYRSVRIVDEMLLYACCREGEAFAASNCDFAKQSDYRFACCREKEPSATFPVHRKDISLASVISGKKIYFFPPQMNKGQALLRLRQRTGVSFVVSAGDGIMDIPMLLEADLAIIPDSLRKMIYEVRQDEKFVFSSKKELAVCPGGRNFAEFLLQTAVCWQKM